MNEIGPNFEHDPNRAQAMAEGEKPCRDKVAISHALEKATSERAEKLTEEVKTAIDKEITAGHYETAFLMSTLNTLDKISPEERNALDALKKQDATALKTAARKAKLAAIKYDRQQEQ
jgi:predicted exporter